MLTFKQKIELGRKIFHRLDSLLHSEQPTFTECYALYKALCLLKLQDKILVNFGQGQSAPCLVNSRFTSIASYQCTESIGSLYILTYIDLLPQNDLRQLLLLIGCLTPEDADSVFNPLISQLIKSLEAWNIDCLLSSIFSNGNSNPWENIIEQFEKARQYFLYLGGELFYTSTFALDKHQVAVNFLINLRDVFGSKTKEKLITDLLQIISHAQKNTLLSKENALDILRHYTLSHQAHIEQWRPMALDVITTIQDDTFVAENVSNEFFIRLELSVRWLHLLKPVDQQQSIKNLTQLFQMIIESLLNHSLVKELFEDMERNPYINSFDLHSYKDNKPFSTKNQ